MPSICPLSWLSIGVAFVSPFSYMRGHLQSPMGFGRVLQDKLLGDEAGTQGRDLPCLVFCTNQSHLSHLKSRELFLVWKDGCAHTYQSDVTF